MTIDRDALDPILPSLAEVRADYIRDHTRNFDAYQVGHTLTSEQEFYGEKFDRWLAAHDADVRKAALAEAAQITESKFGFNRVMIAAAIRAAALGDAPTGGQ